VLVMLARQAIEGQCLADVLLDPVGQARIAPLPALEPGGEVLLGLGEVVKEPSVYRW